jgi:DinB family protein
VTERLGNDLAVLVTEIDANISHAQSLAAGLSHARFNWRSEPGRWSIGQCLSHLNTVNGGDLAALRAAIEAGKERRRTGKGPFTYGFLSRKFVASMEPPATRKFKAPKYYEPVPESDPEETLAEYCRISAEIRRLLQLAAGLDLARVKATLPALPAPLRAIVKMPLGARFELLAAHDRRHLWQADQVRTQADFPAA